MIPRDETGWESVECQVTVLADPPEEVNAEGIIIPESVLARAKVEICTGVLVDKGGNAFAKWVNPPELGDRVRFAKYAGYNYPANPDAPHSERKLLFCMEDGNIKQVMRKDKEDGS